MPIINAMYTCCNTIMMPYITFTSNNSASKVILAMVYYSSEMSNVFHGIVKSPGGPGSVVSDGSMSQEMGEVISSLAISR
jgi:TctA family transporter